MPPRNKNTWTYKKRRRNKKKKTIKAIQNEEMPETPPPNTRNKRKKTETVQNDEIVDALPADITSSNASTDTTVNIKTETPNIQPKKSETQTMCSTALFPAFGLLDSQKVSSTEPTKEIKEECPEETQVDSSPPHRVTVEINENDDCEIIAAVKPVKKMKQETIVNWNEDVVCIGESVIEIEPLEQANESNPTLHRKVVKVEEPFVEKELNLCHSTTLLPKNATKSPFLSLLSLFQNSSVESIGIVSNSLPKPIPNIDVIDLEPIENPVKESQPDSIILQERLVKSESTFKEELMSCDTAPASPENVDSSSQISSLTEEEIQFALLQNQFKKPTNPPHNSFSAAHEKIAIFSTDILSEIGMQDVDKTSHPYDFTSELQEFSDPDKGLLSLKELYLFVKAYHSITSHLHKKFASKDELMKNFTAHMKEIESFCNQKMNVEHKTSKPAHDSPPRSNVLEQTVEHLEKDNQNLINESTDINAHTPSKISTIDIFQLKNILECAKLDIHSNSSNNNPTPPARKRNYSELSNSESPSPLDPRILSKNNSVFLSEDSSSNPIDSRRDSRCNFIAFPHQIQSRESEPSSKSSFVSYPRNAQTRDSEPFFFNPMPMTKKLRPERNSRNNFSIDDAEQFISNTIHSNFPNSGNNSEQINFSPNQNIYNKPQKTKKIDIKEYINRRRSSSLEGSPRLDQLDSPKSVTLEKFNQLESAFAVKDPRLNNSSIPISAIFRQPPLDVSVADIPYKANKNIFHRNNDFDSPALMQPQFKLLTPELPRFGLLPIAAQRPSEMLSKPSSQTKINSIKEDSNPFVCLVPNSLMQLIGNKKIQSSSLYLIIMAWPEIWFQEYERNCIVNSLSLPPILNSNSLSQVRNTYRDEKEHYNTYLKLLLVECWHRLYILWKGKQNQEYWGKIRNYETRNEFMKYVVEYFVPITEKDNMPDESSILLVKFTKSSNKTFTVLGYVTKTMSRKFDAVYDQNNEAFKILNSSGSNIYKYRLTIYTVYKSDDIDVTKMLTHKKLVNIRRYLQQNDALFSLSNSPLCPVVLSPITSPNKLSLCIPDDSGDVSTAIGQLFDRISAKEPLLALINSQMSFARRISVISLIIRLIHRKMIGSKVIVFSKSEKKLSEMLDAFKDYGVVYFNKDRVPVLQKYSLKNLGERRSQEQNISSEEAEDCVLKECGVIGVSILGCFQNELLNDISIACCILDDAHECTEPESVIPLSSDKIKKFILFGNKNSLCEVSPITASYEYNRSLFNRASL